MKRLILTTILGVIAPVLFARDNTQSTKAKPDTAKKKDVLILGYGEGSPVLDFHKMRVTLTPHVAPYPTFSFGIVISRLDLGLTTLIDHNSFTLRPQNEFLSYHSWKSTNAGFDVFQVGERFSDNFRVYLAVGFDWTNLRLNQNVAILPNEPSLTYVLSGLTLSKNRFTSSYLRLPLSFDFRTKANTYGHRFHFVFGPDAGFLITASVKQISTEDGTQKTNNTYNYANFRYGAFTRVGYGKWGVFAKYYFNDMFANSPDQDGLKNFSFGVTLGF
ncbi:PorT family protein [Mucilaginibacter sp. X4EP1]|uniref:PorT family protein n=1 Tax=Mucilaginibacter sp. X4EP1 TaxID=2723092 RepID=UPI002167352B|nr:PorT family protein [Mucilaginibacter sp. X4EP1]MCS3814358.1 hypothetical protein [Mucilaginibacter sp. X4EP1]